MAILLPNGKQSFIDNSGAPLVGGKLYTYQAGTSTPQATWTTAAGNIANTNPVILDARGEATIFWLGTYKIELHDANDNLIWTIDNVEAAAWARLSDLAAISGPNLIGYSATYAYAAGTLGKHAQTVVSVTDLPFGAKCDGVTDDTAAVQAALDYCSGVTTNRVLRIPGKCLITHSLIVNRKVETTTGEFLIIGDGPQGGFYTNQPIKIFDTTIANGTDPQSEAIKFQNVRFECSDATMNAFCFSQDFLRMKFISCYFRAIKCVTSTIYLQDWRFLHCNFRYWTGTFFDAANGAKSIFGCFWTNCTFEFGENGIAGFSQGSALIGNVFEGSNQFLKMAGCAGITIHGNYTEGNQLPDYTFTDIANGGSAEGVSFIGNFMAVTAPAMAGVFNVVLGDVRGMSSSGNYCTGNLFGMTKTRFGRIISTNDYAAGSKWDNGGAGSGPGAGVGPHPRREVFPQGVADFTPAVTAHAGGGRAGAPSISTYLTIVSVCATANDSIVLPSTDDMVDPDFGTDGDVATRSLMREFVVQNNGVANLAVMSSQNDFGNFGLNVTLTVAPGTTRRIAQIGAGVAPVFIA